MTLEKALEISRAAEATQNQSKQMQNIQEVNELRSKNERTPNEKFEGKTLANGSEHIDCKFCGRKHVRDRMKCPAYGQQCNRCGKNVENTKSYPKELFTTVRVNNSRDVTFNFIVVQPATSFL